ncbi:MAG: hypothetical protein JXA15_04155 [Spirochaetales bacterium]|nr:hypothetical protein [Spirochaetales bacterium]
MKHRSLLIAAALVGFALSSLSAQAPGLRGFGVIGVLHSGTAQDLPAIKGTRFESKGLGASFGFYPLDKFGMFLTFDASAALSGTISEDSFSAGGFNVTLIAGPCGFIPMGSGQLLLGGGASAQMRSIDSKDQAVDGMDSLLYSSGTIGAGGTLGFLFPAGKVRVFVGADFALGLFPAIKDENEEYTSLGSYLLYGTRDFSFVPAIRVLF